MACIFFLKRKSLEFYYRGCSKTLLSKLYSHCLFLFGNGAWKKNIFCFFFICFCSSFFFLHFYLSIFIMMNISFGWKDNLEYYDCLKDVASHISCVRACFLLLFTFIVAVRLLLLVLPKAMTSTLNCCSML